MPQMSRAELKRALYLLLNPEAKEWSDFALQQCLADWVDPTTDIAEAWNLQHWAIRAQRDATIKQRLILAWGGAAGTKLSMMTAEEAATWICCTIYWAVEGERVEIREESNGKS